MVLVGYLCHPNAKGKLYFYHLLCLLAFFFKAGIREFHCITSESFFFNHE